MRHNRAGHLGFDQVSHYIGLQRMKRRVFNAMTTPNKLTASAFVGYSPINAVGNEMNA